MLARQSPSFVNPDLSNLWYLRGGTAALALERRQGDVDAEKGRLKLSPFGVHFESPRDGQRPRARERAGCDLSGSLNIAEK
jgi:hypothetical protein